MKRVDGFKKVEQVAVDEMRKVMEAGPCETL